jgi:EAL domain-containing protein (putative c-di-GMP-specific phosphodiesterase class I)
VADEILSGLERNEFVAFYQPQFDAHTLDMVGVEALARWQHPTLGLKSPDAFLAIAEELNVVATIDRLILEQSLADLDRWAAAGIGVPRASVNVSLRRLHDEDLIKGLRQLDIQPGRISFELVESIYLDENDAIVGWNIDQIKDLGIDIEIDDFGTGYASIVSLQKLRPKRLKIDKQLVDPIVEEPGQRRLLASIVDIGKSMGIEVVAEGVETMEQARLLRELGCDILQGYAFAKPMSAGDLAGFITEQRWRNAS